jgi:L-ornithine Nalpha-acyltransferase
MLGAGAIFAQVPERIVMTDRQLIVRLAMDSADIEAAQRLRWEIFCRGLGASSPAPGDERDFDLYDAWCDHLLVEDLSGDTPRLVGSYRLLRQSVADAHGGFYSAGEYDLSVLTKTLGPKGELLELGRSCVAEGYRDSAVIQLLWRGIADYLDQHRIACMFGCASFHGTDPALHADALSYLWHNHLAPKDCRARALEERHVDMAMLPLGGYDPRAARRKLPPLIKAYLRVGASIGDGAVIDADFNTVDVFITMPVAAMASRYLERFGKAA